MRIRNELQRIRERPASLNSQAGKAGYILLWLLGVSIPSYWSFSLCEVHLRRVPMVAVVRP